MEYAFIAFILCDYFCSTIGNLSNKSSYQSEGLDMIQLFHKSLHLHYLFPLVFSLWLWIPRHMGLFSNASHSSLSRKMEVSLNISLSPIVPGMVPGAI